MATDFETTDGQSAQGSNSEQSRMWIKTVVNNVQIFRIVFISQTTNLISFSAALKVSYDGCLFLLAPLITFYVCMCIYI